MAIMMGPFDVYIAISDILTLIAAFLEILFGVYETYFLYSKAFIAVGPADGDDVAAQLAANMGAYNIFIAIGLIIGQVTQDIQTNIIFLSGMVSLAIFGAITVSKSILLAQGLVPALALLCLVLADVIDDECHQCAIYVGLGCIGMVLFAFLGSLWASKQLKKRNNQQKNPSSLETNLISHSVSVRAV